MKNVLSLRNVILFYFLSLATFASAQYATVEHKQSDSTIVTPIELEGPRIGFTSISGELANKFRSRDLTPFITQFGWQFESAVFADS